MASSMTLVRTKADALDDAAPNATLPPGAQVWQPGRQLPGLSDGHPIRGCRFKLVFTVPLGNSADVEVWKRNEAQHQADPSDLTAWSFAGSVLGVPSDTEYEHDGTGPADLYFRLVNVSGGNPVAVYVEPRE